MTQIFDHDLETKKIENESSQSNESQENKQIIKERREKHGKISKRKTSKKNVIN